MNKFVITVFAIFSSLFSTGQNRLTSSNLPIVVIDTEGKTISADDKISANMKIIFNGEGQQNFVDDKHFDYEGFIGIRMRGNSSLSFAQKQYAVETRDDAGKNLNVSLLGMPKDNDWVLYAPYNDISLIRNVYAYTLWTEMGHWGPRTKMVEVILNGDYQGVYVLLESIKRDKNRIDVPKLEFADTSGLNITGGYIMKIDDAKDDDLTFISKVSGIQTSSGWGGWGGWGGGTSNNNIEWIYHYPKAEDIHPKQAEYIHNYIDTVELLIQSPNYNDQQVGYAKYLDVQSFVDYLIHTELSLNADGYKKSSFFFKERLALDGSGGKFFAGSVWDYNLAFGNCNFCNGNVTTSWVYNGCTTLPVPAFWKRLVQDPKFMDEVKCRYLELRKNVLSQEHIEAFIDDYALLLDEAQERHFGKWNKLFDGKDQSLTWFSAYSVSSYAQEIQTLKNWFAERLAFIDANLSGSCVLSSANNDISIVDIWVYPNPVSNRLVVESTKQLKSIEIYNMSGTLMSTINFLNANQTVVEELNNYSKGIYKLLIYTVDGSCVSKSVLKQ